MKICKSCGVKTADSIKRCYSCNSEWFYQNADGLEIEVGVDGNSLYETYNVYKLRYAGKIEGWNISNDEIVVKYPNFGVVRPTSSFLDKGVEILNRIPVIKTEIEKVINHAVSHGHKVILDHIVINGDSEILNYEIPFDVVGSDEYKNDCPFIGLLAMFDQADVLELKISYA
jgi:hypothetical protein